MTAVWWGGLIALAGASISFVLLVVVHLMPTGLNPVRDPMSQYHLTRARGVMAASTLASAVASVGALISLAALLGGAALVTCILLGLCAVGRFVIPLRRMDAPGATRTTGGMLHNVLAIVIYAAPAAGAFVAGGAFHDNGYADAATWSTAWGIVMSVGAVGILIVTLARRTAVFGLFQRVLGFGVLAWLGELGIVGLAA